MTFSGRVAAKAAALLIAAPISPLQGQALAMAGSATAKESHPSDSVQSQQPDPSAKVPTRSAAQNARDAETKSASDTNIVITAARRLDTAPQPIGPAQYKLTPSNWSDVMVGTNPLALAKNLPGVTFTSTDAYGLDLSDANLLIRGFRGNELAYTFEGIPLNDGSYGSVAGTSVLSVGVPDNVGSVDVAPGSARLSTFSTTADGGELRYSLTQLSAARTAFATFGYGSSNTLVATGSAQSGQIEDEGPRILIGIQRISKDKYTNAGTQTFLRGNVKAVQDLPWGDVSAFISYGKAKVWGYNNTSFDMLEKLGWDGTDILYPDYKRAYFINLPQNANLSCGAYTCGALASLVPYDTGQATTDLIGSIKHSFHLSPALSGSVMVYGASNKTDVGIADASTPSLTGAPFSEQVWSPRSHRFGGTVDLALNFGRHTLSAGAWLEHGVGSSVLDWYNEPLLGQGPPLKTIGPYTTYGPAFLSADRSRWRLNSIQLFFKDEAKITDSLSASLGFKAVRFVTEGGGVGPDLAPSGRLVVQEPFLPHLSIDWHPDPATSLFLDAGESAIAYRISPRGNIGPVSSAWAATDQATFDAAIKSIRPEKDWNVTLGASRRFGPIRINVDGYYSLVLDRLLNGTTGPQYAPVRSVGIVPRSQVLGADMTVSANPWRWLNLSQSVSIAQFRYQSDLEIPGNRIALRGKLQPGYPATSFISQIAYKRGHIEAGLTSTVYLNQPFTYSNDIYVPTYWMVNAHASYRFHRRGALPDLLLRLDVNNLLDRHNIGTTGIGGFSVSGDYQTFMRAAPRQALLTVTASF